MTSPQKSIRILIADDHPSMRLGLRSMLEELDGIEVVGEASNGRQALQMARSTKPDILFLDIEMPELSGVEVAGALKNDGSDVRIIALSAFDYQEYVHGILDAGALGYMKKEEVTTELLLRAITSVMEDGEMWISPGLAQHLVQFQVLGRHENDGIESLTVREREVLTFVGRGIGNAEIAETLFISINTVKNHIDHIREKLEIKTRNELIAWAWQKKIVRPE